MPKQSQNPNEVNIDFVGKKDDVAFDGGTAQGYDLVLGSNSFIPGFEEALLKNLYVNGKLPLADSESSYLGFGAHQIVFRHDLGGRPSVIKVERLPSTTSVSDSLERAKKIKAPK